MNLSQRNKIALIEWSYLLEDFLDNIGLTLEDYLEKMSGGWLFGYIEALKTADVETVLFCFSARVKKTAYHLHKPTGATICILPSTATYLRIRKVIKNPYTPNVTEAVMEATGWKRHWYALLLHASSYFSTPLCNLHRQIRNNKCNAILCQDYEHARFDACVAIGKALNLPVFASFQGGNWQLSKAERWLRPISLKKCTGLIVASSDEIKRLNEKYRLSSSMYRQIFNPVDHSTWQGITKEVARAAMSISRYTKVAAWHGRIDYHRKGLDVLIDAWEKIMNSNRSEDFLLLIRGAGVNDELLKERLAVSTAKNILWLHEYTNDRKEICRFLKAADVYVFPSRNEGFPVAPIEAMACGLPVVAADAPGVSDILSGGEESGGILVRREDSNALAASLYMLLIDEERAEDLGRKAERYIEQHFSLEAVGSQLKQFIFEQ